MSLTNTRRLKNVAAIRVSNVDKKTTAGQEPVRLCNYTDVYRRASIDRTIDFMEATATPEQIGAFTLHEGDILITKDSETPEDIGVGAFVTESLHRVLCGYHLALIRPDPVKVDPKYLYWSLCSDGAREHMTFGATGVTRFGLRFDVIGDTPVSVPSIAKQHRIADFLEVETARIDALVTKKRRMIEVVHARFRAQRIAVLRSGNGATPMPLRRLVFGVASGAWGSEPAQDAVDALCVRVADFDRTLAATVAAIPTTRSFPVTQLQKLQLRPGDLLLEKSGGGETQPVGFVAAFRGADGPAVCSNFVARMRPEPGLHPGYLRHLFAAVYDLGLSVPHIKQTTGIQNLDIGSFLTQKWPVLKTEQQSAAALTLDRTLEVSMKLTRSLRRQIDLLIERREALITAAVTGQLPTPD